ncbi:type III secretion system effector HrpZ [Pseudomonas syringae]|uniref:Harpin HrpZ n=1 Tax=Pseudomonas syringae CC1417 TaxID=1357272 RepID=A0AAU8LK43_PSESX
MQSLNSANPLLQTSASLFTLPLQSQDYSSTTQSSKPLQDVVEQLIQALTKNGQLDESSPLGKMLAKAMSGEGKSAGIEGLKIALDKLIHDKLGDNFGASAGTGAGGGGAGSGGVGGAGGADAGQSDLMNQVLNGLGKAALDDLLTKQTDGTNFSPDDMPMLEQIAQFMDDNKAAFPTPDSGSWLNELKEDNFLDGDETAQFRSALDVIGQQLGKQQSDASGVGDVAGGGLGSPVTDTASSPAPLTDPAANTTQNSLGGDGLGQLLGELVERGLQSVLSEGGGLGTPVGTTPQPGATPAGNSPTSDLGQLLGGLLERGLEVTLQGSAGANGGGADLQASAAQTAAQIINTLLQGTQNPTLS